MNWRKNLNTTKDIQSDGVYVSLEQLLALRHRVSAEKRYRKRKIIQGLPGDTPSILKGRGIEFEDIRPYLPGDDLRHVDWRVVAKTGMPFTRRYSEDREHTTIIAVDQRANMFFGSRQNFKSYTAAIAGGLLVWEAAENGQRLGGTVVSGNVDTVKVGNAKRSALELLPCIEKHNNSLNANSQTPVELISIIETVDKLASKGNLVKIVSDFHDLDDNVARALSAIALRCELTLKRVTDPLETNIPAGGAVGISNGLVSRRIPLTTKSRNSYLRERESLTRRIENLVNQTGINLVEVDTGSFEYV